MFRMLSHPTGKLLLSALVVSLSWGGRLSAGMQNALVFAQEKAQPEFIEDPSTNWNILNKAIVVLCVLAVLAVVCKASHRH